MEKEIKKFSSRNTFLTIFSITLYSLVVVFRFLDLFEEDFVEVFKGLIIVALLLAIIFTLFVKWWKDYKLTGKWFVLSDGKIKRWQFLFTILLLVFSALAVWGSFLPIEEEYRPFYKIKEWNPYGYYG